jgi:5-methylcytosine-specific restriction enzyme A
MRPRTQYAVFGRQERAIREQQEKERRERRASTARSLYHTAAWLKLRALQLENYSLCSVPGCGQPATVVDHVTPHRGSNALFFDQANLRSMCKRCHDRKTVQFDGGFGNRTVLREDDGGFGLL